MMGPLEVFLENIRLGTGTEILFACPLPQSSLREGMACLLTVAAEVSFARVT
jgi:hypothetical protein